MSCIQNTIWKQGLVGHTYNPSVWLQAWGQPEQPSKTHSRTKPKITKASHQRIWTTLPQSKQLITKFLNFSETFTVRIVEPRDFMINFGSLILSLNWNHIQCQCLGYYYWRVRRRVPTLFLYLSAFTMTTEHGWMMISSWEKTMIPDPCHSEAGTFWLRKYLLCSVWP